MFFPKFALKNSKTSHEINLIYKTLDANKFWNKLCTFLIDSSSTLAKNINSSSLLILGIGSLSNYLIFIEFPKLYQLLFLLLISKNIY